MKTKLIFDKKLKDITKFLKREKHLVIITDRTVNRLYGAKFPKADVIVIKGSEKGKDLGTVYGIIKRLIDIGADRKTFILGIGGGVVCDITGFVASIFMRGLRFSFVPTTLLAQVDASIGGKNGVNFESYKNVVGLIKQPEFIYYDLSVLGTISPKELRSGFAEVIKHHIISGKRISPCISELIKNSVITKLNIVKNDEQDFSARRILNLGHTLAHAIEAVSRGKIGHGEAVSIGICFAARYSCLKGILKKNDLDRIVSMIASFDLPTELPRNISKDKIIEAVLKDKKKERNELDLIVIKKIGKVIIKKVKIMELKEVIYDLC